MAAFQDLLTAERGAMAWSQLGWKAAEYFAGNFGEELAFRGYFLVVLAHYLGLTRALLIGALLFGLFHLPGLSGMEAVKPIEIPLTRMCIRQAPRCNT